VIIKNKKRAAPAEKSAAIGEPFRTSTPYGSPNEIRKQKQLPHITERFVIPFFELDSSIFFYCEKRVFMRVFMNGRVTNPHDLGKFISEQNKNIKFLDWMHVVWYVSIRLSNFPL
jgi:hypothetical protein